MIAKNHKKNTNFQIVYFLIGSCSTPDGAYSLLCELKEERQSALDAYKIAKLKNKAKEIRAKKLLNGDESDVLEGKAELLELKQLEKQGKVLYKAAKNELNFINKCLAAIEPLRKFKDLPDIEAHEAAQFDEWKGELIRRAENSILTMGTIPSDQFNTMRMHPSFKTEILPRINSMIELLHSENGLQKLQNQIVNKNKFNKELVKLLD